MVQSVFLPSPQSMPQDQRAHTPNLEPWCHPKASVDVPPTPSFPQRLVSLCQWLYGDQVHSDLFKFASKPLQRERSPWIAA